MGECFGSSLVDFLMDVSVVSWLLICMDGCVGKWVVVVWIDVSFGG